MDKPLPVVSHLAALRKRLLVCSGIVLAALALCMPLAPRVLEILKAPSDGAIGALFYFGPEEALLVYMRVGFFCALVLSFPVIIYNLWAFIEPALSRGARIRTGLFVLASCTAFVSGCLFGYAVLLPSSLRFLLGIGGSGLRPLISAARYVSFTTGLVLACGLMFQMPVGMFLLARAGLVSAGFLRRWYPQALVALLVVAAVITPTTDLFNMIAVAAPMALLYEISIWIVFFFGTKNRTHREGSNDIYGHAR